MFNITPNPQTDPNHQDFAPNLQETVIMFEIGICSNFLDGCKTEKARIFWQNKINDLLEKYKKSIYDRNNKL